jgi:ABC-type branched-subunit amino acid transport system ATPase component
VKDDGPALEALAVRSGYGDSEVIHGVDLAVRRGEVCALLGKNGMGKTTLLKTLVGLVPLRSGRVRLFGADVGGWRTHRIARRAVAYVPQERAMFQDLTVEENLRLGMRDQGAFRDRIDEVTGRFPVVARRLRQRAGTLSGGEQKMLLVARAMMGHPRVLLVDEISEGVQPSVLDDIREALSAMRSEGTATLLVEQNVAFAFGLADRYCILKLGDITDRGTAQDATAVEAAARHLSI